jgi:hypothetical protein
VDVVVTGLAALVAPIGFTHCFWLLAGRWPGECHGSDRVSKHVGQPRSQGCLLW